MTTTTRIAGLALVSLLVLFPGPQGLGQEDKKVAPLPKDITWQLTALDQPPIKVVATRYDAKLNAAFWVLELVRDLDVYEDGAYWGPAFRDGQRPRFRFELRNADGIVLRTLDSRYIGEYVNKAGKRFGAVLELPQSLVPIIKTVEAVMK
jgi:hypothetical protein